MEVSFDQLELGLRFMGQKNLLALVLTCLGLEEKESQKLVEDLLTDHKKIIDILNDADNLFEEERVDKNQHFALKLLKVFAEYCNPTTKITAKSVENFK